MNNIQKALKLQDIDAGWKGPEPTSHLDITEGYLTADYDHGLPRMIRTAGDAGNPLDITQLQNDFANLLAADNETKRVAAIKEEAGRRIIAKYPEWKQRNMLARSLELTNKVAMTGTLTGDEQAEVAAMQVVWSWIKDVRDVSSLAESSGTQPQDINWPV